jgi:6-phosphogluconolactonase
MRNKILQVAPVVFSAAFNSIPASAADMLVFFGTHRSGPGVGFSISRFDSETGTLTSPAFIQQSDAPSFFAIHPDGKHLYTCNSLDTYEGKPGGTLSAYAIDPKTGRLTLLNRKPTGANPCHLSLDRTGRFVLDADYNGASICVYGIETNGSLGNRTAFVRHTGRSIHPERQAGPHPHSILVSPDNHYALVTDLGADKVYVYRFDDSRGTLVPNQPEAVSLSPGSGPRHLKFHPGGKWVYVLNELSNTVAAFRWNSGEGTLKQFQTASIVPADFKGSSTAGEIQVHPNGKFLYASNRGHDSIAMFRIDADTGQLTALGHVSTQGKMPRYFGLDPSGNWILLCNHDSDNVVVYRVDQETGLLRSMGEPVKVPNPFCAQFLQ